jgi:cell division protein FtsB
VTRTQVAAGVLLLGGVAFGALGGEYSTGDWWTLRRALRDEQAVIDSLRGELDSLAAAAHALETDPVAQEQAARESFGMLRPGEILYRIETARVEGDSGRS